MSFKHRIVLTGGGTGGHVYPALAVAEQLKGDKSIEALLYIGAAGHLEEKLAAQHQLEFVGLASSGLPRQLSLKLVTWPFQFLAAVLAAQKILARFRPTVILGTGGYASAPPLVAALLSDVPYAIHEPDAHPGLVNRFLACHARLISLGMAGAHEQFQNTKAQIIINGNPISKRFLHLPEKGKALAELGLVAGRKTVVITGGSQGALALNQAVFDMLPMIREAGIQIVHQVGEKNWDLLKQKVDPEFLQSDFYRPRKYFENLEVAYAVSDLTICRAGAMTIAELFVTGTPAIFVPYPFAAQDHQTFNARFVESLGGAQVIPQSELTGTRLYQMVLGLLSNEDKLAKMKKQMLSLAKPEAASDIANQLKQLSVGAGL